MEDIGVSPFARTEGLWFNANMEPEEEEYELSKEKYSYLKNKYKKVKCIHYTYANPDKYYKAKMNVKYNVTKNCSYNTTDIDDGCVHILIGDKPSIKL